MCSAPTGASSTASSGRAPSSTAEPPRAEPGPTPRLEELTRLGGGREAEVFAWDEGRALRLAHDASLADAIDREQAALHAAAGTGVPAPAVYERVELAGRPGLVIERLEGEDLLTLLGRRPWRVASVARTLGGVHASLHATTAPDSLPELRAELRERLRSDLVPQDVREAVLPLLDGMPDGDRLCHGDLHPGNLLPRGDGSHVAIDWSMAARGDPAADVARTRLLILGAALPAETPAPVARLMELGRRLLWRGYLREYERRRGAPLDEAAVATWERIWAAARLAENIAEERKALLGLARAGPSTQP